MADPVPPTIRPRPVAAPGVSADDFRAEFGEELASVLDVDTWAAGRDLAAEYRRIEQEVREAAGREGDFQRHLREQVLPRLAWEGCPIPHAGHYGPVPVGEIADMLRDGTGTLWLDFNLGETWQAYLVRKSGELRATLSTPAVGTADFGTVLFEVVV